MHNFAELLCDQNYLPSSEALCRESLAGYRRVLDDTHPRTFWPMTGLATCLRRQGRFDAALPLAQAAHAGRCATLGEGHPDARRSAHGLGVLLRLLGAPQRALPHARAAFEGRLHALGAAHRDTLASQLSFARLQGDAALASALAARGASE